MLLRKAPDILSSEITDEKLYRNRREFLKTASLALSSLASTALLGACSAASVETDLTEAPAHRGEFDTDETLTPYEHATSYNNYYEFGTGKDQPAKTAGGFRTQPWSVAVEGMVARPATYALDDLLRGLTVYDRIYRMRCVEGWSMVIPWQGVQLSDMLKKLEPASEARFVEFTTAMVPEQMPGLSGKSLNWPYVEGLRLDEAMHPLTIMATGLYGKPLPNQNGAPLRLVVPWKYGFKGIKSIVKIRFTDAMPLNSWNEAKSHEYGFYANVNPNVDHPRWSQATERRLTGSIVDDVRKIPTLMFNGYQDQVASLYTGLDLRQWY